MLCMVSEHAYCEAAALQEARYTDILLLFHLHLDPTLRGS
jgi:hypothetical protein